MTSPGVPFANILHQEAIAALAGSTSFERGKRYFREGRVTAMARREGSLTASVNGSLTYAVKIWSHLDTLAYTCSCPQGQEKAFCKHAVATSLAWLEGASRGSEPPSSRPLTEERAQIAPQNSSTEPEADGEPAVLTALETRTKEELIALLASAARRDELLRARILRR